MLGAVRAGLPQRDLRRARGAAAPLHGRARDGLVSPRAPGQANHYTGRPGTKTERPAAPFRARSAGPNQHPAPWVRQVTAGGSPLPGEGRKGMIAAPAAPVAAAPTNGAALRMGYGAVWRGRQEATEDESACIQHHRPCNPASSRLWMPPKPPLLITRIWSPGRAAARMAASSSGMVRNTLARSPRGASTDSASQSTPPA